MQRSEVKSSAPLTKHSSEHQGRTSIRQAAKSRLSQIARLIDFVLFVVLVITPVPFSIARTKSQAFPDLTYRTHLTAPGSLSVWGSAEWFPSAPTFTLQRSCAKTSSCCGVRMRDQFRKSGASLSARGAWASVSDSTPGSKMAAKAVTSVISELA